MNYLYCSGRYMIATVNRRIIKHNTRRMMRRLSVLLFASIEGFDVSITTSNAIMILHYMKMPTREPRDLWH